MGELVSPWPLDMTSMPLDPYRNEGFLFDIPHFGYHLVVRSMADTVQRGAFFLAGLMSVG